MKIIITIIWVFVLLNPENFNIKTKNTLGVKNNKKTNVYICNSKSSKKYHYNKNCRGLNSCKSTTIELSLTDAKKRGRSICGWED